MARAFARRMPAVLRSQIAVIDDHPVFRFALIAALRPETDLQVVGDAGTREEVRSLAKRAELDLAIVDLFMPGASGLTIAAELHDLQPRCRVLALSALDEPCVIADMLRAGASGYALKTQSVEELVGAIRLILGGIRYLPPSVPRGAIAAELASRPEPVEKLTARERDVFELIVRGQRHREIAQQLHITTRTVETHHQRLRKKLSPHSIAHIQRLGVLHGWRG